MLYCSDVFVNIVTYLCSMLLYLLLVMNKVYRS